MAKIAFVSICDRNAHGLRMMSSILRRNGHECHIVFLKRYGRSPSVEAEPDDYPWIGIDTRGREFRYAHGSPITGRELELLRGLLERIRPDAIGMSVTTPLRKRNIQVTRFLKSFCSAPVIWGGYDPTVNTGDCLEHCDYACVGEGDVTILDAARHLDAGENLDGIANLSYRRGGSTVTIPRGPLVHDLDSLPWRDNSPEHKYFIDDDRLIESYAILTDRPAGIYQTITSRGCPYRCTYCCEATLKDIYTGEKFLRRRSARDAVAELAEAKKEYGATEIMFEDEIFGMDHKWLQQFVPLYREQVGLPFSAYLYPTRNIDKLLPLLQEAGLTSCCVSLQSGSERIQKKVFDRPYDRELFLKTIRLCRLLGVVFYTDVITFNPYEEESDLRKTLEVLLDIEGPYGLCINKLFVLPGTTLAEQMRRDGKAIADESRNELFAFYCRLFSMASFSAFSRPVVRAVERFGIFRRHPALVNMTAIEFGFRVVNALHRRALLLRDFMTPRAAGAPPPPGKLPASPTAVAEAKAASRDLVQIR
jgi:anaerobic magnesium-protoporphyrin IX monomethyl ester cyclase